MSFTINATPDTLANMASAHLKEVLKEAIRKKLMAEAETMVNQAAEEFAKHLSSKVVSYSMAKEDQIHIALVIDGVERSLK